jgi:DNA-binding NarL/FixJ family response regulator
MARERWPVRRARLVIADDHQIARAGLRSMLSGEADLEVVGEAASGREALALCRRLQPDLVVLDVRMPELDGLGATRAIRVSCPASLVILVSMYENPDYLIEALRAGASGYVLKDATQAELIGAVRRVLRGESLLHPELMPRLFGRVAADAARPAGLPSETLTAREREVLQLVAQGKTNREIGELLSIRPGTAKVHVERILAKLGVADRTQAAVRGLELGLVKSE